MKWILAAPLVLAVLMIYATGYLAGVVLSYGLIAIIGGRRALSRAIVRRVRGMV